MADTVEKNLTDAAVAVAKTEAAALKSAEAAYAQASEALVAPVKAVAASAPKAAAAPKTAAPARRKAAKKPVRKAASKQIAAKIKTPTTKAPARAAAKTIKTGAKTMNTQTKKAAETAQIAADQIKTAFGEINERAKTATEKTAKIVEEFADITRGNVEALVASSKVAAKGVETISQNAAEYGRKHFETATAAFKSFQDIKSATDFFKLQGDFARTAFDSAVAESARVSETVLKLAGEVAEPLTSRYTVAAERVKTLAA